MQTNFMPISIFALFKSTIYISALEPFLRSNNIEIVTTCSNSELAIDFYKKVNVDLVMMDINWNSRSDVLSGDSLISQFKQVNPNVKIIAVTSFFDHHVLSKLQLLGIQGYFFRNMDQLLEQIKACIETVHGGRRYYAGVGDGAAVDIVVNR